MEDLHHTAGSTRRARDRRREFYAGPRRARSEHLFALARRQDAQLLAVLGHGAAGDIDAGLLQQLHDLLIAVGPLDVLAVDQLLDLRLHGLRGEVVAVGSRDAAVE